jgi:hypothetical protein
MWKNFVFLANFEKYTLTIKWCRGSQITQRWPAAVCLYCERRVNRIKGYRSISLLVKKIESLQAEMQQLSTVA